MNPITAYVLYTYETATGLAGGRVTGDWCTKPRRRPLAPASRAYLYLDQAAANAMGEKLKAAKPTEVAIFTYMVLPLEGAPE